MNKSVIILSATIIMALLFAFPCLANEYKGEVVKMNASRLEIDVEGAGKRSFQMTKMTRVLMDGGVAEVHRLPAHSKVRVVEKNNKVQLIIVEEVPK